MSPERVMFLEHQESNGGIQNMVRREQRGGWSMQEKKK